MYSSYFFRSVGRDDGNMRLERFNKVGVEFGNERVVGLLLGGVLERSPWEVVNVPAVYEVDVRESERNGAPRLGQSGDVKVGS